MHKTTRRMLFPLFIACSTLIAGCGSSVPAIKPFKMDIQQGNVVTSKMLLQLRPGMTKSQVRFVMGTPLVIDSFHTDRWDYFYQLRQAGKVVEQRRVILDFEKDLLARVRGDVVPQGTPGADTGAVTSSKEPVPVVGKPPEKEGFLESLKFWKSRETPTNIEVPEGKPTSTPLTPDSKTVPKKPAPTETIKHEPALEAIEPAVETPSMLAVPIPVVPAEKTPTPNLPVKPASPDKQDEENAFRPDRNLDVNNIDSDKAVHEPIKNTTKPAVRPTVLEDKSQPIEVEEEPGYFERMLEKIGF